MEKLITGLLLAIFAVSAMAQSTITDSDFEKKDSYGVENINDVVWNIDSLYVYSGNMMEWQLGEKDIIEVSNEAGRPELLYSYKLNDSGDWEILEKTVRTYHSPEQVASIYSAPYQTSVGDFVDTTYYALNDENDNRLEFLFRRWDDANNQFSFGVKRIANYDGNNIQEDYWYDWEVGVGWVNDLKRIYTYNADDQLVQRVQWDWDGVNDVWVENEHYNYVYNTEGQVATEVVAQFNDVTMDFEPVLQYLYTYDSNGNVATEIWQVNTSTWANYNRKTYTYDSDDNLLELLDEDWDAANDEWVNDKKEEREFNANNDVLLYNRYSWDEDAAVFVVESRNEYDYNADFVRLERRLFVKNQTTNDLENDRRWVYYLTPIMVSVNDHGDLQATMSPNPVSNVLTIEGEVVVNRVEIYNVSGQLVQTIENSRTIEMQGLNRGTYFVKLYTDKGEVTQQVVKE